MIERFKQEKTAYKAITMAVLAAAVFFICRITYAAYLTLPYSRELLEPSNVALTHLFMEGKNPYTLSSLEWEVPGINYDYPFINSLIAAAIAKITHCRAITAHLVISLLSILISGYIGILMVKDNSKTTVAPSLAMLMFMFCHWRFGYISAAPDDLGLLFFLLTMYSTVSPKVKYKSIWCTILITLCFYTKQYFIFSLIPIFIYILLYSRKEALKLVLNTIIINGFVAAVIARYWPLYWMRTIAFTYLGTAIGGGGKLETLIGQLDYLAFSFAALFAVILVAAFMGIRRLMKSEKKLISVDIKENDPFGLSIIYAIVMTIPLSFLGRNDGALLSYFLQLWIPSVIVVALLCLERMRPEKHEPFYMVIYSLVVVLTVYLGFGRLPIHILTDNEIDQWKKAYNYTEKFREKGEIFYARSLAYDSFYYGNGDCPCGHDAEIGRETVREIENAGLPIGFFHNMQALVDQNMKYRRKIYDKANDRKYSLISIDLGGDYIMFNDKLCEDYGYKNIDRLSLQMGSVSYDVAFYIPQ